MKKILMLITLVLALPTFAQNLTKLSLGVLSPHGIAGISYEKEFTLDESLSYAPFVGVGAGLAGFMKTIGGRGFYNRNIDTKKWYNRCLFIFEDCKESFSLSAYLHHVDSGLTEVTKDGQELEFSSSSGWLSSISLGFKNIVKNHWVYELEISQRILVSGLDIDQTEGSKDSSSRQDLEGLRTALGASFSVGYQW